jgi:hypothetical protein
MATILNTYDPIKFNIMLLFVLICISAFVLLIIHNIKRKRLYQQQNNFGYNNNNNNNNNDDTSNQCIPKPSMINNTI